MKNTHNISVGRRKSSVARVFYKNGSGKIIVNNSNVNDYFKRESLVMMLSQPLELIEFNKKYDFVVNVNGGGLSGQAGSLRHGISKALSLFDNSLSSSCASFSFS